MSLLEPERIGVSFLEQVKDRGELSGTGKG